MKKVSEPWLNMAMAQKQPTSINLKPDFLTSLRTEVCILIINMIISATLQQHRAIMKIIHIIMTKWEDLQIQQGLLSMMT